MRPWRGATAPAPRWPRLGWTRRNTALVGLFVWATRCGSGLLFEGVALAAVLDDVLLAPPAVVTEPNAAAAALGALRLLRRLFHSKKVRSRGGLRMGFRL